MAYNREDCDICNKKGLAIYISRFGFTENRGHQSPIPKIGNLPDMSSIGSYSLKPIRNEGYIYVLDTLNKDQLIVYQVTPTSKNLPVLKKINKDDAKTNNTGMHQPCEAIPERLSNSMLITVPSANINRDIYICFVSDVLTQDKESYIKKNYVSCMSLIKVGSNTIYSSGIDGLSKVQGLDEKLKKNLIAEAKKINPKSLMAVVVDPVVLMNEIYLNYSEKITNIRASYEKSNARELECSRIYEAMKLQIYDQLEDKLINDSAGQTKLASSPYAGHMGRSHEMKTQSIDHDLTTTFKSFDREWGRYSKKINHVELDVFFKTENSKLENSIKSQSNYINVMLKFYKNPWMRIYFDSFFDQNNIKNGVCYTRELVLAIGGLFSHGEAQKVLFSEFDQLKFSNNTFINNALIFNYKPTKAKLEQEVNKVKIGQADFLKDLNWSPILDAHTNAISKVAAGHADLYGGYLVSVLAGKITEYANKSITSKVGVGMLSILINTESDLKIIDPKTKQGMIIHVYNTLYQQALHSDDKALLKELESKKEKVFKKIYNQIKRLQHQIGATNITEVSKKLALFTPRKHTEKFGNVNKALTNFKTLQQAKDTVFTYHYEKIKAGIQKSARVGNAVKMGIPYSLSILSLTYQVYIANDLFKKINSQNDKVEASVRFGVAATGAVSAFISVVDMSLTNAKVLSSIGKGLANAMKRYAIALVGARLGAGAAVGAAGIEFYYGVWKAGLEEKNYALAAVYFISGAAYIATAYFLFQLSGVMVGTGAGAPVGAGLAISAVVIIVCGGLVTVLKDDALQDWIERSRFGIMKDQRYKNLNNERTEFHKVFAK